MAEITTKPKGVVRTSEIRRLGVPVARLAGVVDTTSELSEELLESLEAGERAAIQAVGRFLVTVEEAVPQEVAGTSDVAKKLTESGLETTDRLVHVAHDVLRNVIESTAKSLGNRNGATAK